MDYLKRALAHVGERAEDVMSHRVYSDHIALVVDHGIHGCQKYIVPLADLPDPQPAEVDATDAALELALEHGIDLGDVVGTGVDGRVLVSDVRAVIEGAE